MAEHDIFISYASVDRERARALAALFEAQGWRLWWDPAIPPGEPFDRVIKRALDGTKVVVALWSKASVESDWVLAEADEGKKRQALVPVLLDAVEIPLGFRRLQAANLVGWTGDPGHPECRKLMSKIAALIAGSPAAPAGAPNRAASSPAPRRHRRLVQVAGGVAAAAVLAGAVYLGLRWYESIRFENALEAARQHIAWSQADLADRNKLAARKKLDAARELLKRAEAMRPGSWQAKQLQQLYAEASRKLLGFENPKLMLYKDCAECPDMVGLPAGSFKMGTAQATPEGYPAERPQHVVTIAKPFAIGRFEVTVHEFELFVRAENYKPTAECRVYEHPNKWRADWNASWKRPQYDQGPDHPVACVSWHDARAYADWLTRKTGKKYRLPTEAEWEYAARAGSQTSRPWGDGTAEACKYANVADESARLTWNPPLHPCRDDASFTESVGRYDPNAFGLYDMIGNVWEWVEDCLTENYAGAPADGSAVALSDCRHRVIRGGAWHTEPAHARSAQRGFQDPAHGYFSVGFRLVREP